MLMRLAKNGANREFPPRIFTQIEEWIDKNWA